ncbi:tyrosine-type recombinase/integrase [Halobacillus litoralis]|uniref:tyrosine-type recombinase/integrase n=1 Tax=Halobacillus litoralis TaxID=45668 RepID=UPI002490B1CA|nr:site-specific integrase [Halobacillus litoralis]
MKKIVESKNPSLTTYLVTLNSGNSRFVSLQIITKIRNSNKYLLLINTNGKNNQDVFYFINYNCQYDTFNSRLQSIQALKLLYSFSEIVVKNISQFTQKDFSNLSRFILGQSVNGTQETWQLEISRSINTHNVYMATIRKYYRYLDLTDKSIFDSTVVGIDKSTFGLLGHMVKRKEVKYNSSISKMGNKKVPKFITLEEYKRIKLKLESDSTLLNLRNEVIINLMYLKGLRLGEVLGLTLEDIKKHADNEKAGVVFIRNRLSDKTYQYAKNSIHPQSRNDYETTIYKERGVQKVVIPEGLKYKVDNYIIKSRDLFSVSDKVLSNMLQKSQADSLDSTEKNYYLFLSKNGSPLTSSGWNYWLRGLFNELKIHTDKTSKKTNLSHRFRHGYAMYLINELNLTLEEVSRYMRHRSISSTYVYYNPTEEEIMDATLMMEKQMNQTLKGAENIEES